MQSCRRIASGLAALKGSQRAALGSLRKNNLRLPRVLLATVTSAVSIEVTQQSFVQRAPFSSSTATSTMAQGSSVYDFKFVDIDGKEQSMEKYKGKVLIVVNVASKCGYTKSNYEDLAELYDKYKDQGLAILGFPCDQFGNQEPATEEEIKNFVCTRYKANFDMAKKINVNGSDAHPLWVFLKSKQGGTLGDFIKWNFTKFVVTKNGDVVKRYGPSTNPKEFEAQLVKLLKE